MLLNVFYIVILILYFTRKLGYNNDDATIVYHIFLMITYFSPIIGAILADSWLGMFRTIVYPLSGNLLGVMLVTISSISILNLPSR